MRVAIGSAFRNRRPYIAEYLSRVTALEELCPEMSVRVIAVEGDSTDMTGFYLEDAARDMRVDLDLRVCEHGGPDFGSVESEARFKALSRVCNEIFEGVRVDDDVLFYVESDLVWDPNTAAALILAAATRLGDFDVHCPMVMAAGSFYDIWGFRDVVGRRFGSGPPFCEGLNGKPLEISSAGSCLAMRSEVARECRVRDEMCLVGWCTDARAHGHKIVVHPNLRVDQP